MERFYFLYDSGENAGLGHEMRCRKIARLLDSIVPSAQMYFLPNMHENLQNLPPHADFQGANLIVDSYFFTRAHFSTLLDFAPKALLCLDDTNRAVYPKCAFVLNGALNAHKLYENLNKEQREHYFCGIEYAPTLGLFTPNFECKKEIENILLCFGGADLQDFSAQSVELLNAHFASLTPTTSPTFATTRAPTLHLVLGNFYPHAIPQVRNLKIYRNLTARDFSALMQSCDIAISAGGGTLIELAQCALPCIMVESAPNQHFQIEQFKALGAFLCAKSLDEILALLDSANYQWRRESKAILSTLKIGDKLPALLQQIFAL
ncbi:hypothetical protein CQA49_09290 [Helicobacter sp. MIT 00-7814]|uniref:hypothetical protein n=1 Tax=unclassified Helicobacter TaxID=2593540 RepID=UPI000E1ED538|nr:MULTISPECIES: hypothetical protein [unclassified Helicobacter]RDU51666.1 hypothetical protein CQA49_09290 [Helicobacter sp. MIT 00-7814]RDU52387.1 hypothetical protein CQA37_08635 [Helicobacter sp. MIT 99-10781]